ncbi:MAG: shikimate dehydrogenase [Oscillospiraceae bacterium]|nr:shikimate dehydrogenase [Oscillospiraceae bacterium]
MRVNLENTTQKLCVIGDPVLHSKSPLIQNTMLEALGLDYIYLCQPVTPEDLPSFLRAAALLGYRGLNATMPHKQALLPLMDTLSEDARRFGAVNTVCIRGGKFLGYNTDGVGFLRALAENGTSPKGLRVTVFGAGGAAKAVALKLAQKGAARVTVCNRTAEKAAALCTLDEQGVLRSAGFDIETLRREAWQTDLLINCTSLGMHGTQGQFDDFSFLDELPAGTPVYDLIYAPPQTKLLAEAAKRGLPAYNGLGLLVHQAVCSLELFTQTSIDLALVKRALQGVLAGP